MFPASPVSNATLKSSNQVQVEDTFLLEDEHNELHYQRRKAQFLSLQERQDISKERFFVLSDDKPWEVFRHGYTSTRFQRRKFVFEHTRNFPTLHQACISNDRDQVRTLLSTPGVCVLERDVSGRIALHHAVINENFKIVKKLLRRRDAKLQVHVRDDSSRTPLHYVLEKMELLVLHRREGSRIPALVTGEMRVESNRYRRLWELADSMLEMIDRRVLDGVWVIDGEGGESIKTLDMRCRGNLWDVCRSGDLERLEVIVKFYGCSKDEWELSELKRTLLHEASENQQLQIVNFLLAMMGSSVLVQDTSGATALHCAARRGYFEVCQMLIGTIQGDRCKGSVELNEYAEEQILLQDVCGRTALHWCLLGSGDPFARVKTALFLAQSCPSALHVLDQDAVSPLHLAIWRGKLELVQDFISLGANVCVASVPLVPPKSGEEVEKASWAPCGIVFQRPRIQKLEKVVPTTTGSPAPDITSSSAHSKKNTPDWENLQHPVEALWYWTRQSSECNIKFNNKVTECKNNEHCEKEAVTEEELGCRKYGGICCRCKLLTTKATPSASKEYQSQLLSPLLLALRVYALKWGACSILDKRVAIVKLLLTNGVPPDEVSDFENDSNKVKEVYTCTTSALREGLRSSLRCPQIIPMLLQHGYERISISSITQWSLSSVSSSKQAEAVLCQFLDLDPITSSSGFLWMLFQQKHFCTLRAATKLWIQGPQKVTSDESTAEENGGESNCVRSGSPWKLIHDNLVNLNKRRRIPRERRRIDIDHLGYLCAIVETEFGSAGEGASDLCDCFTWQLFEYCIDMYLTERSNGYHLNSDFYSKEGGVQMGEQVVLLCIRILLKYWKSNDAGGLRIKSKAGTWLQPIILLGYFDCALVLLETMDQLGDDSTLLDKVLEHYFSALSTRRRLKDGQLCHHRDFLIVVVDNLLKVNSIPDDETKALSDSPKLALVSARSIVHMCANNLSFALIKTCFDTVLPDTLKDSSHSKSNDLNEMRTMRVGGRTMIQWVLANARCDILQLLFMRLPAGLERGLWWSAFISASRVVDFNDNTERSHNSSNFVDNLFSIYLEHVQDHLDVSERKDLLINLVLKCAIPTDSVVLFKRLLELLGSISPGGGEPHEIDHLGVSLKQAGVLHTIARWNAVRVADFCLSRQCSGDEPPTDPIDWQQRFIEDSQERHELDECTPLELCRQLGHLYLFNWLSSTVQPSLSEFKTANVEINGPELEANIDSNSEPTRYGRVGLLRAIIEINESLVVKNKSMVETFYGYHRCAKIQDPWESAVAQNQVSHLQAMSLMQSQCSSPATSVRTLILMAIQNAAWNSLKWILASNTPITKYLSDEEGVECMHAAAKHPGVVYAEMTLLLLEHQLSPGRLSGDGMGISLLHRVSCFSSTTLACRIMKMLLERSDSDVNALDAFGNTAVSYALAAGCLHNACFLIQNSKCRLEAEYEGQSCFYYALHIVPSFAWRTIVRELLLAKRNRAFLHCDADNKTCGCKSYELPREGEHGNGVLCGFCGHESSSHRLIPLPSWFRDQYDTYIVAAYKKRFHSNSSTDESDDSDGETSQHYSTENNNATASDEDEETVLENGRGRLDVQLLKRITMLRYDDILHTNGLSVAVGDECCEDATVDGQENKETIIENGDEDNCEPEIQVSTENESKLEVVPASVTKEMPLDVGDLQQCADHCVDFNGESISSHRKDASTRRKFTGPWWLRQELAMVHSPRCLCQKSAFVTSPAQLVHVAVCRWLRRTAKLHATTACDLTSSTESPIVALAAIQPAFEHWCDVVRRSPVDTVSKPRTPLPRILRSVLFHWRHNREFLAFQRWKNYQTSAEVSHHRLATRLEHVAAEMRRHRFITLQLRQQHLQDSTRNLLSLS